MRREEPIKKKHPPLSRRIALVGLAALVSWTVAACINSRSDRGVVPRWRDAAPEAFQPRRTTRAEVLEVLGPPSQILSLQEGTAFYSMLEMNRAHGLILLVYNWRDEDIGYDRAVFFFDERQVLTDYALSGQPR